MSGYNVLKDLDLTAKQVDSLAEYWRDCAANHTSDSATVDRVIRDALVGVGPDPAAAVGEAADAHILSRPYAGAVRNVVVPGTNGVTAVAALREAFLAGANWCAAQTSQDDEE